MSEAEIFESTAGAPAVAAGPPADADLVRRVSAGDHEAFEELYRRHAAVATRVATSIVGDDAEADDVVAVAAERVLVAVSQTRLLRPGSFRSYFLSATRNTALNVVRARRRTVLVADGPHDLPAIEAGPEERAVSRESSTLLAEAFVELPDRWQAVLWLTEVQERPAAEVGERLGLSTAAVAQLAARARAGLRTRYLQLHVADAADPGCAPTVKRLGGHVAGTLPPGEAASTAEHLAGCAACRDRVLELEDVGGRLRRIVVPLPVLALRRFGLDGPELSTRLSSSSSSASSSSGGFADTIARCLPSPTRALRHVAGAASAVTGATGLVALLFVGDAAAPAQPPPRVELPAAQTIRSQPPGDRPGSTSVPTPPASSSPESPAPPSAPPVEDEPVEPPPGAEAHVGAPGAAEPPPAPARPSAPSTVVPPAPTRASAPVAAPSPPTDLPDPGAGPAVELPGEVFVDPPAAPPPAPSSATSSPPCATPGSCDRVVTPCPQAPPVDAPGSPTGATPGPAPGTETCPLPPGAPGDDLVVPATPGPPPPAARRDEVPSPAGSRRD